MCTFWQTQNLAHSRSNKCLNLIGYGIKVKVVAADQEPVLHLAPKHITKLKLESGGWGKNKKQVCSDGEMQSQSHSGPLVAHVPMINCCSSHLLFYLRQN